MTQIFHFSCSPSGQSMANTPSALSRHQSKKLRDLDVQSNFSRTTSGEGWTDWGLYSHHRVRVTVWAPVDEISSTIYISYSHPHSGALKNALSVFVPSDDEDDLLYGADGGDVGEAVSSVHGRRRASLMGDEAPSSPWKALAGQVGPNGIGTKWGGKGQPARGLRTK